MNDLAITIEHVGSTAVPGLAAKPIIDLDIVIPSLNELPGTVIRLERLGYTFRGNLGVEDRFAFSKPAEPAHHLYVCPRESRALLNHLTLRDHLRNHPPDVAAYAALKKDLAQKFPYDIESYWKAKSDFILSILRQYGCTADCLD